MNTNTYVLPVYSSMYCTCHHSCIYSGPCTQGGMTALMIAVQNSQHRAVKLLITDLKCDKGLKDEVCALDGWTVCM